MFVGDWLRNHADPEGARAFFRAAKMADPNFYEAEVALALMDIGDGKLDSARSALDALISRRTHDVSLLRERAYVEIASHRVPEAVALCRRILEVNSNDFWALNNIAYLLANSNRADEALAYAQHAKEVAPRGLAEVEDTLGWVLYRKGIYPEAVGHLEVAAQKSTDPAIQYHLGLAYVKAGNRAKGERMLTAALKVAPGLQEAQLARQEMGINP